MKLSKKHMILGGAALLAGAGWLVHQKMSPSVADSNNAKIAAILDQLDPSLPTKVDKINQLTERYDISDPTVRGLIESETRHILDVPDNIELNLGDGTVFHFQHEKGGSQRIWIESQETISWHTVKTTFTDTNWDCEFDDCEVKDGANVSTRPCAPEDREEIRLLLDKVLKASKK